MSDELGIGDAQDLISQFETKLDGLADELDSAGDERDTLVWLVAEMSASLPPLMMTIRTMAAVVSKILDETGIKINPTAVAPNRAARRQAQREAINRTVQRGVDQIRDGPT